MTSKYSGSGPAHFEASVGMYPLVGVHGQARAKLNMIRDMAQVTLIDVEANGICDGCGSDEAWS